MSAAVVGESALGLGVDLFVAIAHMKDVYNNLMWPNCSYLNSNSPVTSLPNHFEWLPKTVASKYVSYNHAITQICQTHQAATYYSSQSSAMS